jgi:hypothetical protein
MYVLPFAFHTSLTESTESVIHEYECGDKIWVHMEQFESIMGHNSSGELIVLELRSLYDCGFPIAVSIGGFHSETDKNIVYAPCWIVDHLGMMEHCTEEDKTLCEVSLKRIMPSPCSKITIQPFITKLSTFDDPEKALQNALEKYTCVYANSTINLLMPDNSILKCSLYDCVPNKDEPLCIRDIELVVNLLPAKDYIIPVSKSIEEDAAGGAGAGGIIPHSRDSSSKYFVPFSGKGYKLDGKE